MQEAMEDTKQILVFEQNFDEVLKKDHLLIQSDLQQLKSQVDELKNTLTALHNSTTPTENANDPRLINYLRINDYLLENKEATLQHFQQEWQPHRNALFAALGKSGSPLGFEVDDVFLYKGSLVVTALFLWSNPDASGGVLRSGVSLDPDKEFEISGLSVLGESALSSQQLASFVGGADASETQVVRTQQLEAQATASGVQARPDKATTSWVSDETKNKMLQSGVAVGAAWLMKQILSNP